MGLTVETFGIEEKHEQRYRGHNPAFVQRVWARRREEAAIAAREFLEAQKQKQHEQQERERKVISFSKEVEQRRIERMVAMVEAGGVMGIIAEVALAHNVTVQDILSPGRSAPLVKARHEAMCEVARRRPAFSLPQIGKYFNRDHTTVLSCLRKHGVRT